MATTQIIAVGKMSNGGTKMRVPPGVELSDAEVDQFLEALLTRPAPAEVEPDGTLQRMIDYRAELQELIDGRLDNEYHASGNW